MANIEISTLTRNNDGNTYIIKDANAIPKSGGAVNGSLNFSSTWDYASSNQGWFPNTFNWFAGNGNVGYIGIYDDSRRQIVLNVLDHNGVMKSVLSAGIDASNNVIAISNNKNLAMQEDTVPRSGGAVMDGMELGRNVNTSIFTICGGAGIDNGAFVRVHGKDYGDTPYAGSIFIRANNGSNAKNMVMFPSGTWTWEGTACQITSDQRLKQQITQIDDKLLDAWEDVTPCQFKYNDAVDAKKDKARLHTGYVVQQIDEVCKSHNIDISNYGLYCHEEYPERTEEVEVQQEDGTTKKETKVIEEASEHYSLRYTETLVVECAYLRRENDKLKQQIQQILETLELHSKILNSIN